MSKKQMTPAQAEAALQAASKKNEAKAQRRATFLVCSKCDGFLYAGERGCRNGCRA